MGLHCNALRVWETAGKSSVEAALRSISHADNLNDFTQKPNASKLFICLFLYWWRLAVSLEGSMQAKFAVNSSSPPPFLASSDSRSEKGLRRRMSS